MFGKTVRLNRNLYGLKQASKSWYNHLITHAKSLGLEQSPADECVLRLVKSGSVSILTVVHVDDIFAVGLKVGCDQFCEDLNCLVPINDLGELRWYAGCRCSRDWDTGTLTTSQQASAENTAAKFGVSSGRNTTLSTCLKFVEFDKNECVGDCFFRELVGCLMWPANQTRPFIANAVRAVSRYADQHSEVHWKQLLVFQSMSFLRVIFLILRSRRGVGLS